MTQSTEKKQAIFEAAEALFLEHGPDGVSMASIAQKAAVPASLICHHFKTKEKLFTEIVAFHYSGLKEHRAKLREQGGNPKQKLRHLMHGYYLELAKNSKLRYFLKWIIAEVVPPVEEMVEDVIVSIGLIKECQVAGLLPQSHDPRQLLSLLLGMAEYPMLWRNDYLALMEGMPEEVVDTKYLELIDCTMDGLEAMAKRERLKK